MAIKNNLDLTKIFSDIVATVIHETCRDIQELLVNNIDEYTYRYGGLPNANYYNGSGTPTWQFLEAFRLSGSEKKLNTIVQSIFYDWQSMEYDSETFLHGSPYNGDMRKALAEVLNVDGSTGFSSKQRKPYWDITIKQLFDEGKLIKFLDQHMKENFAKVGLQVRKKI